MNKATPAIRYFVTVFHHACFISLLLIESNITNNIETIGVAHIADFFVFYFVLAYLLDEICQWHVKGTKRYFSSWTNAFDVVIIVLFVTHFVTQLIDIVWSSSSNPYPVSPLIISSISYAMASFLFILRFFSFLRLFPTIGPITSSFKRIFYDSLSLLFLWSILLLAFSVVMSGIYATTACQRMASAEECNDSHTHFLNTTERREFSACERKVYNSVVPEKMRGFV